MGSLPTQGRLRLKVMVLLSLPYQQISVAYHENGTHYTWWETLTTPDSSCGGGYYVKTLPVHERSWWWSPTLGRWRRIQWTLEDVTRSVTGPGWDLHWSWAYADAYECHEERYPPGVVFPQRTWYPEGHPGAHGPMRRSMRTSPY